MPKPKKPFPSRVTNAQENFLRDLKEHTRILSERIEAARHDREAGATAVKGPAIKR
jgi:hypothetical protein